MIDETISHYRILEKLGGGGMGVVYKAEDIEPSPQRRAEVSAGRSARAIAQTIERFQREARAASALNHPNICTIHEIDEFDGRALHRHGAAGRADAEAPPERGPMKLEQLLEIGGPDRRRAGGRARRRHRASRHQASEHFLTQRGQAKILDFGLAKLTREPAERLPVRGRRNGGGRGTTDLAGNRRGHDCLHVAGAGAG